MLISVLVLTLLFSTSHLNSSCLCWWFCRLALLWWTDSWWQWGVLMAQRTWKPLRCLTQMLTRGGNWSLWSNAVVLCSCCPFRQLSQPSVTGDLPCRCCAQHNTHWLASRLAGEHQKENRILKNAPCAILLWHTHGCERGSSRHLRNVFLQISAWIPATDSLFKWNRSELCLGFFCMSIQQIWATLHKVWEPLVQVDRLCLGRLLRPRAI